MSDESAKGVRHLVGAVVLTALVLGLAVSLELDPFRLGAIGMLLAGLGVVALYSYVGPIDGRPS